MPNLTTKEAQLEKIVEETKKIADNLPAVLSPVTISEENVTGNYYNYLVPDKKVFANFNRFDGKTVAWNQLVDTGTSSVNLINGHKYYTLIDDTASIQTGDGNTVSVTGGTDKVTDMTLAFGSGNEPSLADFQAMFPNYASENYNAGTLLSAEVSSVIAKDSSNNVVANMPIPSAIKSLDGYGWSAGSVYNYVDFSQKKFVKNVGSVDLGSLTWVINGDGYFLSSSLSDAKYVTDYALAKMICSHYIGKTYSNRAAEKCIVLFYSSYMRILVNDPTYNDATAFKTAMENAGAKLFYELATPVETDISSIMGATGIACKSGGTLTFANVNGNDYCIPVYTDMDLVTDADGLFTAEDKAKLDMMYEYIQRVGL